MSQIKTAWHRIREAIDAERVMMNVGHAKSILPEHTFLGGLTLEAPDSGDGFFADMGKLQDMCNLVDTLPKYYVEPSLLETMLHEDVFSSVEVMKEAGILKTPFKEQIVELETHVMNTVVRHVVLVQQLEQSEEQVFDFCCHVLSLKKNDKYGEVAVIFPASIFVGYRKNSETDNNVAFGLKPAYFVAERSLTRAAKVAESPPKSYIRTVNWAILTLVLVLNTRGVVSEKSEAPAKLNKSRVAKGKRAIQECTVIKIGSVYSRTGEKMKHVEGSSRGPNRVHWRRPHYRTQRYGKELKESKRVFIEAVLVNYVGGDKPVYEAIVKA